MIYYMLSHRRGALELLHTSDMGSGGLLAWLSSADCAEQGKMNSGNYEKGQEYKGCSIISLFVL